MAIADKVNATAMSTNRAKVCIYLLSPVALDLPFDTAEPEVDEAYTPAQPQDRGERASHVVPSHMQCHSALVCKAAPRLDTEPTSASVTLPSASDT
jgi:hypothetical protein